MIERVISPTHFEARFAPPGDKSISHRSAILNALSTGEAIISNYSPGADCLSTLRCLQALGVSIEHLDHANTIRISGLNLQGFEKPTGILDAGNSGTTMRVLSGILAGQSFSSVITGDESLRSRPMDRIINPLVQMGAQITGYSGNSKAPLMFKSADLQGIEYRMPIASAQVKSCIIMAALYAKGKTVIHQPMVSRDHTERMLKRMGGEIVESGLSIAINPGKPLSPIDLNIPGDISSAAYWLVAAACHPSARITVVNVGMNPTRTGILDVLRIMGANISIGNMRTEGGEDVGDITIESSQLIATEVTGEQLPRLIDEIPLIALAACFAKGETVIKEAGELRTKESDRIKTIVQELSKLGADISEMPDGIIIRGTGQLHGNAVMSHGDHRIAITMGIAGLLATGTTTIDEAEIAKVSYPDFWDDLKSVLLNN
jgi:3-phosphoshikimate 1-carboxyvinyltransferase